MTKAFRLSFGFLFWFACLGTLALATEACQTDELGELLASGAIGPPGGTVRSDLGTSLIIPPSSLTAVYRFELKEVEHDPPAGFKSISKMIQVAPANVKFVESLPASLFLSIDRSNIASGQSLFEAKAFFRDGDAWKPTQASFDDGNALATLPITQSGTYAVFIGPPGPPPEKLPPYEFPKEPTPEPTPEPSKEPSNEPSSEKTVEPSSEKTGEPAKEPAPEPSKDAGTREPAPEPSKDAGTSDAKPQEQKTGG